MDGFLLLADGARFEGSLSCHSDSPAIGWLAANTAVVDFQQMLTDPCYRDVLLAFTYPEVGNTGVSEAFLESPSVQPCGVVVREICENPSHCRAERNLAELFSASGKPFLSDVDTRGVAVHIRKEGEMPGAIAAAGEDIPGLLGRLEEMRRPKWEKPGVHDSVKGEGEPEVAVIDLGMRNSFLSQLCRCCNPVIFPHDVAAETILKGKVDAVIVTDGPAFSLPPGETADTIGKLAGRLPLLACGLGSIALGMALGCRVDYLRRGHHGANYPVRNIDTGLVETTGQRHSVILNRESIDECSKLEVCAVNVNDSSVEGIRTTDGTAAGHQHILAPHGRDEINRHILSFIGSL